MLSCNASTCRELSFCPVADIRDWLGIPDAAGVYRGIRANMEQTYVVLAADFCHSAAGEPSAIVDLGPRSTGRQHSGRRSGLLVTQCIFKGSPLSSVPEFSAGRPASAVSPARPSRREPMQAALAKDVAIPARAITRSATWRRLP